MKKNLKVIGTGFAMGIADLIPGVSGGTIAFISGYYDQLVRSISEIDGTLAKLIFSGQRKKAWSKIDGIFLLKLFGGIISAILLAAHLMSYLMTTYPTYIKGFFSGVISASAIMLLLPYKNRLRTYGVPLIIGILLGISLTTLHVQLPETHISLLPAGILASIAMILPGISGSYILLILGKYELVLGIVTEITSNLHPQNLGTLFSLNPLGASRQIGIFIVGVILGLVGFSKILHWLLDHYHTNTLFILVGLMIGALPVIRPRPYTDITVNNFLIMIWIVCGAAVVYTLYILQNKKNLNP